MSGGTFGQESTLTRSEVLAGRGYGTATANGAAPEPALEELPALVVAEPARPTCALAGCAAPLPPRRRRYCSTSCAAEAERQRIRTTPPSKPSSPRQPRTPAKSAPSPPADAPGHLALVEFVAGLLAAGSVAEVEVTIAGATVVARAAPLVTGPVPLR
jgi:hypothetical protein